jgi:hypothetical protein
MRIPKVGDTVNGRLILEVKPYNGGYPQYFTHVIKTTSDCTDSGTVEFAYNSRDQWYYEIEIGCIDWRT